MRVTIDVDLTFEDMMRGLLHMSYDTQQAFIREWLLDQSPSQVSSLLLEFFRTKWDKEEVAECVGALVEGSSLPSSAIADVLKKKLKFRDAQLRAIAEWLRDPQSVVYSLAEILEKRIIALVDNHAKNGVVFAPSEDYQALEKMEDNG